MTDKKIIELVKKKLKIQNVDREKLFQDGYQVYYDGNYICNIKED